MKFFSSKLWLWSSSTLAQRFCILLKSMSFALVFLNVSYDHSLAQGVIPTKGTDFWIGVTQNYIGAPRSCDVFITSDVNTSGTISIPAQGWSQPFSVTANITTTITLPLNLVENSASEVVTNRGVQILSNDTVSVFAMLIEQYTSDATVVYPKLSLGTDYMISSYKGSLPHFLIIATEDNTEVSIVPSSPTTLGKPAGVPFLVSLNKGQSYLVTTSVYGGDMTGSTIIGTSASGSCRPFAVFSGATCVNIPVGCSACDVLYEQALPTTSWGREYYVVPFGNTKYTLKLMAKQNGTVCTLNGMNLSMNAGQIVEYNHIIGTYCIQSNLPICVTQYMQGQGCGGSGDPSMMYINSNEQKIDKVTFSTVTSTIITSHNVNVIMNTAHTSQLKLDGVTVPSTSFTMIGLCNTISYATLSLTPGSHTLSSDSGFSAYVYGSGGYESYAYSVGSFSKDQPIQVDSILCSSDTMIVGSSQPLFGQWWSSLTNPNDTIGIGPVLTLIPPIIPDIYILHGNEFLSGCESVFYFDVSIPTPPQVWTSQTSSIACQNQLVQLNAGTTPLSSNFQYRWSPAAGLNNANIANPVLTASVSQWYVVEVSSINGCSQKVYDSVFVSVFVAPLPVVNAGPNQQVCLGDSVSIIANGGVSYLWSTGAIGNILTFTPLVSSNIVVFVTDSNGCGNTDTVFVKVEALPNANAGIDKSICENSSTTLTATGGVNYNWQPGSLTGATISISPPNTTTYWVEVIGSNGCTKMDSITVTVNPMAIADAGVDQEICLGDSATLIASGGSAYFWTPGSSNLNTITVSPVTSSNYVVMVNNSYNCFSRDTVRVIVRPLPLANAGVDQSICIGSAAALTATGGMNYTWQPGGNVSSTINVNPLISTTYSVLVEDSIGCKKTDSVVVTVNNLPNVNLGVDVSICYRDSILLSAPTTGQSYLWSPLGSATKDITVAPLTNTFYILTLTDFNSCVNSDTIQVIVHPEVIADAGPNSIHSCVSLNTSLSATGGVGYLWTPGGLTNATIVVSPLASTVYTVTVSDAFGCTSMDSVQVLINPLITGSSSTSAICLNDSITLINSNAISYLWLPGGSTDSSVVVSPTQSASYVVYMELSNGCLVYDTTYINVNPLPLADAGLDQEKCIGQNAILNASGGISYWWTNTGSASASIMVTPATSDYYVVIVTDGNGCSQSDSLFIKLYPLPVVDAGNDEVICKGDSVLLQATGGISYTWFPGGLTGSSNYFQPLSTTSYIVIVTDTNGCVNKDSVLVIPIEDPEVSFNVITPICEKEELIFKNNSSISIGTIVKSDWTFGDGSTSSLLDPVHNYTLPGTYPITLIVESDNGCIDSLFTTIFINVKPVIDFTLNNECVNSDVQFTDHSTISTGAINKWNWNFGDGNLAVVQHPLHAYSTEGFYSIQLTATSDSGCSQSKTISNAIQIYPLPIANFRASPFEASIYAPQIQFEDESIGNIQWRWNFADGIGESNVPNPFYEYSDTGRFNVELIVTSVHGCLDTMYREIYITPGLSVFIPNAFTPNDDGNNDSFYPSGIGYSNMQMFIFNRWGDEVFSTTDATKGWDGKSKNGNDPCSNGVYVYVVKLVDFKNTTHEYNGTVSLYR